MRQLKCSMPTNTNQSAAEQPQTQHWQEIQQAKYWRSYRVVGSELKVPTLNWTQQSAAFISSTMLTPAITIACLTPLAVHRESE